MSELALERLREMECGGPLPGGHKHEPSEMNDCAAHEVLGLVARLQAENEELRDRNVALERMEDRLNERLASNLSASEESLSRRPIGVGGSPTDLFGSSGWPSDLVLGTRRWGIHCPLRAWREARTTLTAERRPAPVWKPTTALTLMARHRAC